jgi:hypothetical protein
LDEPELDVKPCPPDDEGTLIPDVDGLSTPAPSGGVPPAGTWPDVILDDDGVDDPDVSTVPLSMPFCDVLPCWAPPGGFMSEGGFQPAGGPFACAWSRVSGSAVAVGTMVLLFVPRVATAYVTFDPRSVAFEPIIGITTGSSRDEAVDKLDWPKYMIRAIAISDKNMLRMAKTLTSTFIILPSSNNIET